ncbi:MAG: DNA replication/repair protein RecF [Lachnospiraceae bacterium]|nr:DNA replication/repair protein RecF [Lachnospiraceae bacterium]
MYIKTLKLKNYRNYEEVEVSFDPNINIIYGNNAVGKTNLLESIYICSTSKSHKNTKENDIINFNKNESHIKLIFCRENIVGENANLVGASSASPQVIDIQLNKDTKKGIAKNGIKVEKLSEFLGFFNVIMFAPEDLNIIKDGPMVRRKFLDVEISQTDKIYVQHLQNYHKTLNQRNSLLKDIYKITGNNRQDLIDMLDTYDEQLVNYGLEVIKKRKENIKLLAEKILNIHLLISNNKEKLIVSYENDILNDVGANANLVGASTASPKDTYLKKLKETRDLDIKNQYTLVGPHRDDICFVIDGNDIRKFGSQGQKKTAAISLKLSELETLREKINDTPVLLLDDVFSELDESRQKLLVSSLKGIQTIITCTGIKKNIFDLLKPEKIFNVFNNKIIEKI